MSSRTDKWLWAVRIFKTRSEAAEACKHNKVLVNEIPAKPARELKLGDIVTVKRQPIEYKYKVLNLIENRQPAKNVPLYAENLTSPEELENLKLQRSTIFVKRDKGMGRPSKKERRDMLDFNEHLFNDDSDDENFEL
ncbi:MAG: RNA-binding S4 domain-containing protein [Prevotellaceae bacterium]|jgi:ribosome-associated heat shock protein Hsp15|nr:RNA-binding S4 domain-containing protein [Prevotellaceae bacterium]